jgi:arsenical pump membrane protein
MISQRRAGGSADGSVSPVSSEDAGPASSGRTGRWSRLGLTRLRRVPLGVLDWIAVALFTAGLVFVATGLLPSGDATDTVRRIWPILVFLATILVLAELTAAAGVFDVAATRLAIAARGNFLALFLLCCAFAALTTITLNLDTTAVLLTPVMLALARTLDVNPLPLAMCTVWLANTASLLLPVSNLTNLLAAGRVGLSTTGFAARLGPAQAAALAVTLAFLWACYWRRGRRGADRYAPPAPHVPADRWLFRIAAAACLLFIAAILGGVVLEVASAVAAGVTVLAFAVRDRSALHWGLIPWRLPVFVTGLFLVVQTISVHLLGTVMSALISSSSGLDGVYRAALTGAGLANLVNNLPAYLAGEAVIPAGNHTQLLGLLVGVNVGPLITPWASLATLLWYERCVSSGVAVPLRRFVLTSAGVAVAGIGLAVAALYFA